MNQKKNQVLFRQKFSISKEKKTRNCYEPKKQANQIKKNKHIRNKKQNKCMSNLFY